MTLETQLIPVNPAAATDDQRFLDRSLTHGIAWTAGLKAVSQALSWAATLFVARLLSKEDYGLFGMALMYHGFVQLVNEFGLGSAIVRSRDLSEDQIASLGGISIAFSFGLWALSALLSSLVALFFGEPQVRWLIIALGATFVTTAVKVVPRSLLARDLQFKRAAQIDTIETVTGMVATLGLALLGYAYWSLVIGTVLGGLVSSVAARRWRPHPVHWPSDWRSVAPAVTFGWHIVVGRLAWYAYSNADFATVGRVLGKAALGAYSIGWTLASIPVTRVSTMVGQVTPGIFSAVQDDPAKLRRYVLNLTQGLALITFPLSVGLALVAPEFVLVVLGEKWRAAIIPLQLLAFYGGFRSITTLLPQVLISIGQSRKQMHYNLLALVVLVPLFYVGTRWGTGGVAAAWLIGYPIVAAPIFRAVGRSTHTTPRLYFQALWPALSGCLVMAAIVLALRMTTRGVLPAPLELTALVIAGALGYVGTLLLFHRPRVTEAVALLKGLRN